VRVGLICPYDLSRFGGVQNQVHALNRLLGEHGDESVMIGPGAVDGIDLGGSISVKANRSIVPLRLDPRVRAKIIEAIADVDVVHLHEPMIPAVGWAAIGVAKPLVATFHADKPKWASRLYRVVPDRLWRRRVLTAVSAVAADLPWPAVRIIPNGIQTSSFRSGGQRHRQRVVFVGRDDRRKGLDVLVQAWAEVHEAHPSAELVVIGAEGIDRQHVRYVGRVTDAEKSTWLQSAAVLAAPNLGGESFGMNVAEGMAAGCAVVATDLPAFRELTGGTARLTPVAAARPLASALIDLLTSGTATAAMGKRARERIKRFDWSAVFPRYRAAYDDAIDLFNSHR